MIEDSFIIITEDGNLMHFKHAEKLSYHKNMLYKAICNEREFFTVCNLSSGQQLCTIYCIPNKFSFS